MHCTAPASPLVLLIFLNKLTFVQVLEIDEEDTDYTFEDYGDEKLLWGKESSPQWCEAPVIDPSMSDRITLRSSFIDANSKGQYATETIAEVSCGPERRLKLADGVVHPLNNVYLRCTLNTSGTGGVWTVVGSGGTVVDSSKPACVHEEPSFHMCELPHLIHRGLRVTATKRSRFFKHNDTLSIRCAFAQNTLHPPGRHTLRCIGSNWVHEVDNVPSGIKYPTCVVLRSICTTKQVPSFLTYTTSGTNCQEEQTSCLLRSSPLSLGTKLELRCKDDATRLVGPSSVVCLNLELQAGSAWYPSNWPNCIPKLNCSEPFIHRGGYIAPELSNGTFRGGVRVWFECWEGYTLYGNEVIECLKSGLWNESLPVCVADESRFNEHSATVLLLALAVCLFFVLIAVSWAVYRQNRRIKRQQKLSQGAAANEMLLRRMYSVAVNSGDKNGTVS